MPDQTMLSYVYAIGRREVLAPAAAGLTGVADGPVRAVDGGGLAAAVSSVPQADFDDDGFRSQLEDLSRLEAIARAHHGVVDGLAEATTVLPLRLGTVYLDDANVARMLEEAPGHFTAALDRLEGRAEWGVKVYACPRDMPAPAAPADPGEGTGRGRAYLRRRQASRARHTDAYRAAADATDRIADLAGSRAADRVAHRPQSGELAVGEGENVANVSYLLPHDEGSAFRDEVRESVRAMTGVRVEVTGPWAPYSFAEAPPVPVVGGTGAQ